MFMELRERMVSMRPFEPDKVAMAELTMKLRGMGVTDTRLLRALELVPRRMFVAAAHQASAYLDRSLPIECGQTINAPSTVALMVSALAVEPGHKVLEVGCGSGFQAAILAHLAAQVVTMDRFRSLIDIAEDRLTALKITNVITLLGDGLEGFTRYAPYDRILLDGAVEKVPTALLDQLADRGILVAPVGVGHTQTLVRISRDGRLFHRAELGTGRDRALHLLVLLDPAAGLSRSLLLHRTGGDPLGLHLAGGEHAAGVPVAGGHRPPHPLHRAAQGGLPQGV